MAMVFNTAAAASQARGSGGATTEIEEYRQRLELLYDVAQQASSLPEISMLLEHILQVTQQLIQAEASSLLMIDRDKKELCFQVVEGKAAGSLRNMRLDLDSGIAGWVAHHGKSLISNDVASDKRFNSSMDRVTGFVTRSIIAVPVNRGRKLSALSSC